MDSVRILKRSRDEGFDSCLRHLGVQRVFHRRKSLNGVPVLVPPHGHRRTRDRKRLVTTLRSTHPAAKGLVLAALGIVFGDIGTSPLYSMQTVFAIEHHAVTPTHGDVMGIISLVFWSILLIVCIKYVTLVMRADNDGEGGILALMALLRRHIPAHCRLAGLALGLGMVGAALFYGDSMITPAISVMSALEGVAVVDPALTGTVLPASVIVLTILFVIQRQGTAVIGKAFGPIMAVWFLALAALGVPWILRYPQILEALSPQWALLFIADRPWTAFVAMGAVVLTVTGAEALYADMGHFGTRPIRLAWFAAVMPALTLNYLGQGAMIIAHPTWIDNPFFRMAPGWATVPLVVVATMATIIASQAVISGTFSVSHQASRLGLLPRFSIRHTSRNEGGQIYIPEINWTLYIGVLLLIAVFQSSARLSTAYGLAVTGTLLLTTVLFLILARLVWGWALWRIIAIGVVIGGLELSLFAANLLKIASGGWIPLVIAGAVIVVMTTWRKGTAFVCARRAAAEGPLDDFLACIRDNRPARVPGLAVYPHPDRVTTPLALRNNLQFNHVLHEHNVIVSIVNENVPHIRHACRIRVTDLGDPDDGVAYVECHVGFADSQDIPKALALAIGRIPELQVEMADAVYFLSVADVRRADGADPSASRCAMSTWRKIVYVALSRNQADRTKVFRVPRPRSVVLGEVITI